MNILDKTIQLVKDSEVPVYKMAVEAAVSPAWIYKLRSGRMPTPAHDKVVRLYEYLSGRRLEV
jgi:hypothetical protein